LAPAWLWCPAPLEASGSSLELPGSRQSPDPLLVKAPLEPGLLPSSVIVLSTESMRYYEPLRLPTRLHPHDGARLATPRRAGSPVLRCALCRHATPLTPVSDPAVIGRLLTRNPSAFPVQRAGQRSQLHFRGLLGLHTRCGPSACRPTHGGSMSRELQRLGYPPRRLGSYWGTPTIPQAGLSPARAQLLSRHTAGFRLNVGYP
jgi:hypothetical protein